ncbi:MAG: hypothetical protein GY847_29480 [Proteobacteria bacterium]|nr:hypothetical protein [Pseudomonadota bacterium]
MEKLHTYRNQFHTRIKWFLVATVLGLTVALASNYGTYVTYPAWKLGVLVHGLVFWPWLIQQLSSKEHVSTREVGRILAELKHQKHVLEP